MEQLKQSSYNACTNAFVTDVISSGFMFGSTGSEITLLDVSSLSVSETFGANRRNQG